MFREQLKSLRNLLSINYRSSSSSNSSCLSCFTSFHIYSFRKENVLNSVEQSCQRTCEYFQIKILETLLPEQSHPGCFSLSESSIRVVMGLVVRFLAVLRE